MRAVASPPIGWFFSGEASHWLELIGQTMVKCQNLLRLHQPHRDVAIRAEQGSPDEPHGNRFIQSTRATNSTSEITHGRCDIKVGGQRYVKRPRLAADDRSDTEWLQQRHRNEAFLARETFHCSRFDVLGPAKANLVLLRNT